MNTPKPILVLSFFMVNAETQTKIKEDIPKDMNNDYHVIIMNTRSPEKEGVQLFSVNEVTQIQLDELQGRLLRGKD